MTNLRAKNALRIGFLLIFLFEIGNIFFTSPLRPDFTWLGLAVTSFAIFVALEGIDMWLEWHGRETLAAPAYLFAFLGLCIDLGGDLFHAYSRYGWYDRVAHFLGSGMAALVLLYVAQAFVGSKQNEWYRKVVPILVFALGVTLGALYEVEEYLEDMLTASHRLGDGVDTADDLLMDMLGAAFVALLYVWHGTAKARERGAKDAAPRAQKKRRVRIDAR